MLRKESVNPSTFDLLQHLMAHPLLKNFALGGGTSIALRIGHRQSIDLDLFSLNDFDAELLLKNLEKEFQLKQTDWDSNTVHAYFNKGNNFIKVDLLKHSYQLIKPVENIGNIRLLSIPDIIAMKLNAVSGRGSKKDFIDIYFLLKKFHLGEMINFYVEKYENRNIFSLLKSLQYFQDADEEPDPVMIIPVSWNEIKRQLIREVNKYIRQYGVK